jgi:hypothetical protein
MDDLFASAALDLAIPPTHWSPPNPSEDSWTPDLGPHASRNDFLASIQSKQSNWVLLDQANRCQAQITWGQDSRNDLWIHGFHASLPDRLKNVPIGYSQGAFPTEECCKEAARHAAMESFRALEEAYLVQHGRKPRLGLLRAPTSQLDVEDDLDADWDVL